MLGIIVSTLFISLIINITLKKYAIPTIIGYIVTGTAMAYIFGLHSAANNHELKEIAEFGIVFLMFTIGLEFSVKHLMDMKYEVFVVGSLQILLTTLLSYFASTYFFGLDTNSALIISMAVALSSTAIVLKTFNETGEINKSYGRNSLGILIMQDIAVIPILIIIGVLGTDGGSLENTLYSILLGVGILLVSLYVVGKYLLEPFFAQIIKTHSDELFIGSVLFLAIGASHAAYSLGFSYSLGAFVAGMLISETKYKHQAEADLIPFRDLLLGIFFITVGMQIRFDIVFEYWGIILLILASVMVMKFFVIFLILKLNRKNTKRTTLKTAFSLIQIGEFALAILELARANSLVQAPYSQIMVIVIVISMIVTPFLLKKLSVIADFLVKDGSFEDSSMTLHSELSGHVVVLGYGGFGQSVAKKLKNDGKFYVVVENNIETYQLALKNYEPVIYGNAANREILKKAFIDKADKIIIAIENSKKLELVCSMVQMIVDNDIVIVKVHSTQEKEYLLKLGLTHIIVENEETTKAMLSFI